MREIITNTQNIKAKIEQANNILVATHQNPDGDALGAVCAWSRYLDEIKKNHILLALGKPLPDFSFLVNAERIKTGLEEIKLADFDLIITLDAGDLEHIGIKEIIQPENYIINIDHHPTNTYFGQINLVAPQAVATTEILYHLFNNLNYTLSPAVASCLLVGIIGDTNNFTNHNTTHAALEIAGRLLSAGGNMQIINKSLLNKKTVPVLNFWGKILSRLTKNEQFNSVSAVISRDDWQNVDFDQKAIEGLTNFLNNLSDVKLTLVLKETKENLIKVSLRTNEELIDLTNFVKIFGGGGHKKAAGFTLAGKLVQTNKGWQVE